MHCDNNLQTNDIMRRGGFRILSGGGRDIFRGWRNELRATSFPSAFFAFLHNITIYAHFFLHFTRHVIKKYLKYTLFLIYPLKCSGGCEGGRATPLKSRLIMRLKHRHIYKTPPLKKIKTDTWTVMSGTVQFFCTNWSSSFYSLPFSEENRRINWFKEIERERERESVMCTVHTVQSVQ